MSDTFSLWPYKMYNKCIFLQGIHFFK
uniref:Uncharacterized protein n=1 Tax=Anguilla anguilla TaxID=7936 RepID=A0A0E9PTC8_ANGAN